MSIFKNDPTSKLEAELARLENRKAALATKLIAAQSAEAAAKEAQRRFFVETENLDASDSARLSAAVASAVSEVAAVTDAIATVDAMIAEGRQAVVAAKESAARAKRASEIEAKITKLEPLAATAEKQFEALAATLEQIASIADDPALDVKEYHELQGHGATLPASSLVAAALAESIFTTAPDLLTVKKTPAGIFARASINVMTRRHGGMSVDLPIDKPEDDASFIALPLSGALTANLVDPLRTAAAEIVSGERPLAPARPIADEGDEDEPAFGWRRLVFVRPVRWQDWQGEQIETPDSDQTVPAPVALEALRIGAAFEHGTKEAERHIQLRENAGLRHEAHILNKADWIDLQVRWPATTRAAA